MSTLQQIGILIVSTLGSLYLIIIVLRFLLQLARADFYNPISQFIAKATNPLLLPLRRVIPGVFGLDMASVILAIVFHWVIIEIMAAMLGAFLFNPADALGWAVIGLLSLVLNIYFFALIVMIIASWVAPGSYNPVLMLSGNWWGRSWRRFSG